MTSSTYLLIYFLAFFALGFVWRSWQVYRLTGSSPLVLPTTDDAAGYVGRAFKLLMGLLATYLFAAAGLPDTSAALAPVLVPQHGALASVGWAILTVAWPLLLKAQHDMGLAWRIGVNENDSPNLVSQGLFARSRNPIFLSMRMALWGMCLVHTTVLALCLASLGEVLMQIQVRLEEAYLARHLGEVYARYQAQVPRWV